MKKTTSFNTLVLLSGLFCCLLTPHTAWGHKVTVFAWVEGDTVYTQSKFSGGKKVNHGKIEVYDPSGVKLHEGRTNDQGEYAFKVPKRTDMKIVLLAGMGHRGEWTLMRDEIEEGLAPDDSIPPQADGTALAPNPKNVPAAASAPMVPGGSGDVEAALERVLDKKLRPILQRLNTIENQNRGPRLKDILGGIGYILGLMGLAAYLKFKQTGAQRPKTAVHHEAHENLEV